MDYRLYHAINEFVEAHAWLGQVAGALEAWAVPAFALATVALWLLARPGTPSKWRFACVSALASAGLALLVAQAITRLWARPRPFSAHPDAAVWTGRSHDPSFPSDHAAAAFAIAVTVLLFDRLVGTGFLVAASAVALGRVVVGAHYPADVLAGALLGAGCALVLWRAGRPLIRRAVAMVQRVSDPLLARAWRLGERVRTPLPPPT